MYAVYAQGSWAYCIEIKCIFSYLNVKMQKSVGILICTRIGRIITTYDSLRARKLFIFQHFTFYKHLNFILI